jgi:1,4-dihydroxy-2-naphthoate octaprenyltransferase
MTAAPGPFRRWVLAARPRTLPTVIVPVAVGASLVRPASIEWVNTVLCVAVGLALQIGTNFANDYSDGVRGTDHERVGPFRLTASSLVKASSVRLAAWSFFALSGVAGLVLASRTSWWLVVIGLSAILAGWFYTGGPRPYGYYGFGELFVVIYFGFVATVGTSYVQHRVIPNSSWWFGLAMGAMACALLEANNLRDVEGDQLAGKKTLAARLGRVRASWLYAGCVAVVALGFVVGGEIVIGALAIALFIPELRSAFSTKSGRDLLPLLKATSLTQLLVGGALVVTFFSTR